MASVYFFRFENLQHNVIPQQPHIIPSNDPPTAPTSQVQLDVTMSLCLNLSRHGSSNTVEPLFKQSRRSIDNPSSAFLNLDSMLLKLYEGLQTDNNFIFEDNFFPKFDAAFVKILRHWDSVRRKNSTSSRGRETIILPVQAEFSATIVFVEHIQETPPVVQQITNYDEDYVEIGRAVEESRMVPATESSIKRMLKNVINVEQGKSCMVCLEQLQVGSCVSQMPCSHDFHRDCIETWLKQSHYCPICRFEMPTEEEFN
ncbi:Zinc finger, RING-type [Corchorus capsularis]|uniref:RING-type E3 ubiquitin transferase n=1 Tax=Corchorus capsularis TaxID=210143 RepID=A0A1R3GRM0_COCAP|nr:Zinc finger, RING-type [Corchorus capsularis]